MDERTISAVRQRPGMYIGGTDQAGLHQIICQVLGFLATGHHANHTKRLNLTIHADHSVSLEDDGIRPLPQHEDPYLNLDSLADNAFLGLDLSLVQAVCEWFIFETWQTYSTYRQKFRAGQIDGATETVISPTPHGTRISFRPDSTILSNIAALSFYWLSGRARHYCACNAGLQINMNDERTGLAVQYQYQEGLKSYLQELQEGGLHFSSSLPPIIHLSTTSENGYAEVAFCWSNRLPGRSYSLHSFIHDAQTYNGGTHLTGFKLGVVQALQNYATSHQLNPNNLPFAVRDVLSGIIGALNIRLPNPKFVGALKEELESHSARYLIQNLLGEKLPAYFEENAEWATWTVNWLIQASHKRLANSRL